MNSDDEVIVVEDDASDQLAATPAMPAVTPVSLRALGVSRRKPVTAADVLARQKSIEKGMAFEPSSLTGLTGFDHPVKLIARRGLWLIILVIGCLVNAILMITIYSKWLVSPIEVRPSLVFELDTADTKIDSFDLRVFGENLVSRMNRWSSWTIDGVKESVLPFFSPERKSDIDALFEEWKKKKTKDGIRSNCFITGSIPLGVENNTIYSIAVYFEKIESLEEEGRRVLNEMLFRRMVVLDVVRVQEAPDNPQGLQVIGYTEYTEQQVKSRYNQDPWTGIRNVKRVTP